MRSLLCVLGLLAVICPAASGARAGRDDAQQVIRASKGFSTCRVRNAEFTNGEKVLSKRAHEVVSKTMLPFSFFWGNVSGVNYLTENKNQHIPKYCGGCWAFATSSAIADRIKIIRQAAYPEVSLATQVLINCHGGGSCEGGNPYGVYEYMERDGLPDETCQNYEAVDGECKPFGVCETCSPGVPPNPFTPGTCLPIKTFTKWTLTEFGHAHTGSSRDAEGNSVRQTDKLKAELYARGPIACGIHVTNKFEAYTGGIFSQWMLPNVPNHEISVVGWGIEEGVEYWIARNSWGTYWGEGGFFRIRMHGRNLNINNYCSWAVPYVPPEWQPTAPKSSAGLAAGSVYPGFLLHQANQQQPAQVPEAVRPAAPEWMKVQGSYVLDTRVAKGTYHNYEQPGYRPNANATVHVKSPLPHTYMDLSALPDSYDIRNMGGVNFASIDRNQHIPQYCGSCWTHGTASALSDRFALMRNNAFPEIDIAPQVLVNCVKDMDSNGCYGGEPTAAYSWIYEHGIVDETCSNYRAVNHECTAINTCKSCDWDKCWEIPKGQYREYRISEHGQVVGAANMMAEIAARGPIACSLCVTDAFEQYAGGVFKDTTGCTALDHTISIAGWGRRAGRSTGWGATAGGRTGGRRGGSGWPWTGTWASPRPATGPCRSLWGGETV